MASSIPVIATNVGGNPELVEHGTTGQIVPPADSEALAEAMRDYVLSDHRRTTHGRAARRRAVSSFSMKRMLENYMDLYNEVLAL